MFLHENAEQRRTFFDMRMRRGFTLVELLIVIVIIGILAAAMLLSSGSATASARAAAIISDLRNLKSAALFLYTASMDESYDNVVGHIETDGIKVLAHYVDNPDKFSINDEPVGFWVNGIGQWWLSYKVENDSDVRSKLAKGAKTYGLYNTDTKDSNNLYTADQDVVWYRAR